MSTHNISYYGEIRKHIPELSSNTPPYQVPCYCLYQNISIYNYCYPFKHLRDIYNYALSHLFWFVFLSGLHGKYCGFSRPPGVYHTSSDSLTLYFRSDSSVQYSGFEMIITRYHTGTCINVTSIHKFTQYQY